MSHFCVVVIGPDFEGQLAPYQENKMGTCPEEYLEFVDTTDKLLLLYGRKDKNGVPFKEKYATLHEFAAKHYHRPPNENGRYGYYENPHAKWDWYKVGGRWTGFFPLKKGAQGKLGELGVFGEKPSEGTADIVRKCDIDFDAYRNEALGVPFAFVKDSKWYQLRETDCVADEKEWNTQYWTMIESLPDDTLLTCVDAHI